MVEIWYDQDLSSTWFLFFLFQITLCLRTKEFLGGDLAFMWHGINPPYVSWRVVVIKYHGSFASKDVLMPKISCKNGLCFQILDGKDRYIRASLSLSSHMGRRGRKREETVTLLIYQQNYGFHNLTILSYSSLIFGGWQL